MGKSRSQISQQLVTLLAAAVKTGGGSLFTAGSAFEAALPVENYIASGKTFPIAVVQTSEGVTDPENSARFDEVKYTIGVAGGPVTEVSVSSNLASSGTASSQHVLEGTIRDILAALNPSPGYEFTDSTAHFQGEIVSISSEKVVPGQGQSWAVAEIVILVYNATRFDN